MGGAAGRARGLLFDFDFDFDFGRRGRGGVGVTASAPGRPSKIICVGRNYVAHARELGNEVPERPLLFFKPPSALIGDGEAIVLPPESQRVEHEGEIGVVIGRRCRRVAEHEALDVVAGYVALNDVTARDLQKSDGQWARAKGFDSFCPVGPMAPAAGVDWRELDVTCRVNGVARQHGYARDMAFGIPFLVHYISGIFTLEPGDLIATGTPEGVGPLGEGDEVLVEVRMEERPLSAVRSPVRTS
ncbi:MAG: fumarylacetoacetate hydrolase family protein [Gemmatimonadetes bacterium]|nr:fumarylacetoacetate hydrolase family protein [Gemmatimonadota bacterium]